MLHDSFITRNEILPGGKTKEAARKEWDEAIDALPTIAAKHERDVREQVLL